MADSGSNLIARLAALMFFIAMGTGLYALITHGNLQAVRAQLASVEQERAQLKSELIGTEKTVLANSSDLKTCTKDIETFKSRRAAQADPAPQDAKTPKSSKAPQAAL